MEEIIKTVNLTYTYSPGTPFEKQALRGINFSAYSGELIALIGRSGCGKSTFIQHLNGLLKPTSGLVYINGKNIWQEPLKIRNVRFKVGLVFQYPEYQLFAESVEEDIAYGLRNMGLTDEEIMNRVDNVCRIVGIPKELKRKSPFEISGGQKRRAAIAGVLAMEPQILILDEPAAGLDPIGTREILNEILRYKRETGSTVILVTHSMEDAVRIADRIVVMDNGQIIESGTRQEVFSHAEKLKSIGLDVPLITDILIRLKSKGISINTNIYTVDSAKNEILDTIERRNDNA